jgi:hypothetical protein
MGCVFTNGRMANENVSPVINSSGVRNVFRRALLPSSSSEDLPAPVQDEVSSETATTKSILPAVDRHFLNAVSPIEDIAVQRPRRIPWLESVLLLAAVFLALQLYPPAASKTVEVVNITAWTWRIWAMAEVIVIVVLSGVAIRRRRYS